MVRDSELTAQVRNRGRGFQKIRPDRLSNTRLRESFRSRRATLPGCAKRRILILARILPFNNAAIRRTLSNAELQRVYDDQNGFTTARDDAASPAAQPRVRRALHAPRPVRPDRQPSEAFPSSRTLRTGRFTPHWL